MKKINGWELIRYIGLFILWADLAFALIQCYNIDWNILSNQGDFRNMEWSQIWTIVGTILGALIGFIATIIASTKSGNSKLIEFKDVLSKEHSESKLTLSKEHSDLKSSLSSEHKDILFALKMKETEERLRLEFFSEKQKDTKKKVEEIADFLQDWEKLIVENNEQSKEIRNLKEKISELTAENSRLTHILQNALQNQNDYGDELEM